MFKVESDVPPPKMAKKVEYPFFKMKVGDSFVAEAVRRNGSTCNAASAAYMHAKRNGVKFSVRSVDGGKAIRIWRIA